MLTNQWSLGLEKNYSTVISLHQSSIKPCWILFHAHFDIMGLTFVWKIDFDYLIGFHHNIDEFMSHSPILSCHKGKRSTLFTTRRKKIHGLNEDLFKFSTEWLRQVIGSSRWISRHGATLWRIPWTQWLQRRQGGEKRWRTRYALIYSPTGGWKNSLLPELSTCGYSRWKNRRVFIGIFYWDLPHTQNLSL